MTSAAQCYSALRDVSASSRGKKMSAATAATLTAIAGAESGWNLHAKGDLGIQTAVWGPSYGLWQIRTLKAETGRGTSRDIKFLEGGLFNQAAAAYDVWRKQGLRAWSTYKSGAYKRFTAQARTATKKGGGGPVTLTPGAPGGNGVGNGGPNSGGAGVSRGGTYTDDSGGGGGATNVGALTSFAEGALSPLNWAGSLGGGVVGTAGEAVWGKIQPFAITGLFVLGGLALFVVGAAITAEPARQKLEAKTQEVGGQAASAAKMGAMLA